MIFNNPNVLIEQKAFQKLRDCAKFFVQTQDIYLKLIRNEQQRDISTGDEETIKEVSEFVTKYKKRTEEFEVLFERLETQINKLTATTRARYDKTWWPKRLDQELLVILARADDLRQDIMSRNRQAKSDEVTATLRKVRDDIS